ncbi:hypothetical protein KW807_01965 [Candidatus Parcubacteria bacterium]|nr:hypothetical protein [Candidatus Parcubacteria bacterium]
MFTIAVFSISGIALVVLTLAKRVQEKRSKTLFILHLVSRGDERARDLYHQVLRLYSLSKERAAFFIKKRIPMRSRHSLNKLLNKIEQTIEKHLGDIRDSRLLRKSDGISEFFKNMNTVEKGVGEINDVLPEEFEPQLEPEIEVVERGQVSEPVPEEATLIVETPKPKKRTYKPRVKKIKITEE